ncbi:MAG: hypothetical protein FWH16_02745 [Oscillospiraceae bacterium]|nr:hypothetical protein [Oscillospiraceae bacterium]
MTAVLLAPVTLPAPTPPPPTPEPEELSREEVYIDELEEQMEQQAGTIADTTAELTAAVEDDIPAAPEISAYDLGVILGVLAGFIVVMIWAVTFKV